MRCSCNPAATELTVVLPLVNASGDYDRYNDGDSILYYVSGGKLYRKPNSSISALPIGKDV